MDNPNSFRNITLNLRRLVMLGLALLLALSSALAGNVQPAYAHNGTVENCYTTNGNYSAPYYYMTWNDNSKWVCYGAGTQNHYPDLEDSAYIYNDYYVQNVSGLIIIGNNLTLSYFAVLDMGNNELRVQAPSVTVTLDGLVTNSTTFTFSSDSSSGSLSSTQSYVSVYVGDWLSAITGVSLSGKLGSVGIRSRTSPSLAGSSATLNNTSVWASVTVDANSSATINGGTIGSSGSGVVQGSGNNTINIYGATVNGGVSAGANSTIYNSGTINGNTYNDYIFTNYGTINSNVYSICSAGGSFTNNGNISGQVELSCPFNHNGGSLGSIWVRPGGTFNNYTPLTVKGNVTNFGQFNLNGYAVTIPNGYSSNWSNSGTASIYFSSLSIGSGSSFFYDDAGTPGSTSATPAFSAGTVYNSGTFYPEPGRDVSISSMYNYNLMYISGYLYTFSYLYNSGTLRGNGAFDQMVVNGDFSDYGSNDNLSSLRLTLNGYNNRFNSNYYIRSLTKTNNGYIYFPASYTMQAWDTLTLQGSSWAAPLYLRSTSSGSRWYLAPPSSRTLQNLDIQDSYANSQIDGRGLNNRDSGNNVNWLLEAFVNSVSVPAAQWYYGNDYLNFTVNWSGLVSVTGTPSIPVVIGSNTRQAVYYSGTGTATHVYRYQVQGTDMDYDGISVGSSFNTSSGTLKDASNYTVNPTLNGVGGTSGVYIQGSFALTLSNYGSGTGTITKSPDAARYFPGTTVTLTATTDAGSIFAGWNGAITGTITTTQVLMNKNQTVYAAFELQGKRYTNPTYGPTTPGWGVTRFSSIQTAINMADVGDEILAAGGAYVETVNINKNITLTPEAGVTIAGSLNQYTGTVSAPAGALTISGSYSLISGTLNANTSQLNLGGSFTYSGGIFNPGTGQVSFTGADPVLTGAFTFYNLEMRGSGTLTASAPFTSTHTLLVTSGAVQPPDGALLTNVTIMSGATLDGSTGTLNVTGDWAKYGSFTAGSGTVAFTGSGAQALGGSSAAAFYNLTVNKPAGTLTGQTQSSVSNHLTVQSGTYKPATNTSFTHVAIALGAALDGSTSTLNVSGDWTDTGAFTAGLGTVVFNGSGVQNFSGTAIFNNLTINDGAALTLAQAADLGLTGSLTLNGNGTLDTTTHKPNTLRIAGSSPQTLPTGLQINNLVLDSGSQLTAPTALAVSGDLTTNGTFSPAAGTVTFNGSLTQTITGTTTPSLFYNLSVSKLGGSLLGFHPVTASNNLNIIQGQMSLAANSDLTNVNIVSGAALDASAGALTVSGSWADHGTFTPGSSSVTFDGTGVQNFSGATTFNNVSVGDGAALTLVQDANLGLKGYLSLNGSGGLDTTTHEPNTLTLAGTDLQTLPTGLQLHSLTVAAGANFLTPAALSLRGNLTNDGAFDPDLNTVTFNGAITQTIGGLTSPTSFHNLVVNKSAGKLLGSIPVVVKTNLDVQGGTFAPAGGSDLNHVAVASGATLDGSAGALTVSGNWTDHGSFISGAGSVLFDGVGTQIFSGVSTFNDLTVNDKSSLTLAQNANLGLKGALAFTGTGSLNTVTHEPNTFTIAGTSAQTLPTGLQVSNFVIASGAHFNIPAELSLHGDLIVSGTLNPGSSKLFFNGSLDQTIGGPASPINLYDVEVNKASGKLIGSSLVAVGRDLTLVQGTFKPTSLSQFENVSIASGATLDGSAGALYVSGDWTDSGAFASGTGSVIFNGTGVQDFSGTTNFYDLTVDDGAVLTLAQNANLGLTGALALNGLGELDTQTHQANTFTIAGSTPQTLPDGLQFSNLMVASGAQLIAPAGLLISRDLTNDGSFAAAGGLVTFNGSITQTVGGLTSPITFADLEVNKAGGVLLGSSLTNLSNQLTVTAGSFKPASGSSFTHVDIAAGGRLDGSGGTLNVSGNWANSGLFTPGTASLVFNGTGAQAISGSTTTDFYNLTINKAGGTLTGSSPVTVSNTLNVLQGAFKPADKSGFNDIGIASGATLDGSAGELSLSGDWTDQGTFIPGPGSVVFSGPGVQVFSGEASFNNLLVQDGAVLQFAQNANLSLLGGLTFSGTGSLDTVTNEPNTFTIAGTTPQTLPTGLQLYHLVVNSGAQFTAPNTLALHGNLTNDGAFDPALSTLTFNGAGKQIVGGTASPTDFYNLALNNPGGSLEPEIPLTVGGTLEIQDGSFVPFTGSVLQNLTLGANGVFTLSAGQSVTVTQTISNAGSIAPSGGTLTVGGNFNNSGSYSASGGDLNLGGSLANSGSFLPGAGTVTFNGLSAQAISGSPLTFANLVMANPAGVTVGPVLTVTGGYTLTKGAFNPTSGTQFNEVYLGSLGTLALDAADTLYVSGSLTNDGTFNANSGTLELNGASAQHIGGTSSTTFGGLLISNSGAGLVTTSSAVAVLGSLDVKDGTFKPASGSDFNQVTIQTGAVLDGTLGPLTVSGGWSDSGSFMPGSSPVTFDGSGTHPFSGTTTFNDLVIGTGVVLQMQQNADLGFNKTLVINGTGRFDASTNKSNTLRVAGTTEQTLPTGLTPDHLVIESGAVFKSPANISLTGDFINDGTFNANNGRVSFVGTQPQDIGGSSRTNFNNLRVNNATGVVSGSTPLDVSGVLTVQTGTFNPAGGTIISNLTIQSAGKFTLGSTDVVTLTNVVTNDGVFATSGTVNVEGDFTNTSGGKFEPLGGNMNLTGDLFNAGTFAPAQGTITFMGSSVQTVAGNVTFAGLTLDNPAGVNLPATLTVVQEFTVNQGTFNPVNGSHFNGITIGPSGKLNLDAADILEMSGNFTNNGVFAANGGSVLMNGTGSQLVGGSAATHFGNLTIDKTSGSVSGTKPLLVDGTLVVLNGTLDPANGSTFHNLNIRSGGTFNLETGQTITVTQNVTNTGIFNPAGGTANLLANFLNSGTFSPSGGTLNLAGSFTNDGAMTPAGGSLKIAGGLVNNNLMAPSGGTITFNGSGPQAISGTQPATFASLEMSGSGTLTAGSAYTVTQTLTASGGTLKPPAGSVVRDVAIAAAGALDGSAGVLEVSGDWTNSGSFTAGTSAVVFNGSGAQNIGGLTPTAFHDLTVLKTGGVLNASSLIAVTNDLSVQSGSFSPFSGSSFSNVTIASGAALDGSAGTLNVSGDWSDQGGFVPGAGSVIFGGPGTQVFSGSSTFNNLTVADGAVLQMAANANLGLQAALTLTGSGSLDTSTNRPNTLTIAGSAPQTLPAGLQLSSLVVASGAQLNAPDPLKLSGDLINNGSFNPLTGTLTFNGSITQTIGGTNIPLTLYNLDVDKPGGTLTSSGPLDVANQLAVTAGTFYPASGSSFGSVLIAAGGVLDGSAGTLNVSGDWSNLGSFTTGAGSVVFNGTGLQSFAGATIFNDLTIGDGAVLRLAKDSDLGLRGGLATLGSGSFDATTNEPTTITLAGSSPQTLASGLQLSNLVIAAGAELTAPASLSLHGSLTNNGIFNPGTGTLSMNGSGPQTLGGTTNPTTLYNLTVNKPGGTLTGTTPVSVGNNLAVTAGEFAPASGTVLTHVTISSGAVLTGPTGELTVMGDWSNQGSFSAGTGSVVFGGAGVQNLSGTTVFNNLSVADGAALTLAQNADLGLTGTLAFAGTGSLDATAHEPNILTIGGTTPLTLPSGLQLSSLVINSGAQFAAPALLSLHAGFTNNGSFDPAAGTLDFNGSGVQTIGGTTSPTSFYNLNVNTSGGSLEPVIPVAVAGLLDVQGGTFVPYTGSVLDNLTVGTGGIFTLGSGQIVTVTHQVSNQGQISPTGGTLNIGGDFTNSGNFAASGGNLNLGGGLSNSGAFNAGPGIVTFNGSTQQAISGSPLTFSNLVLNNLAGVTVGPVLTVSDTFTLTKGTFNPTSGTQFHNVHIQPAGSLALDAGDTLLVSGDLINNGAFNPGTGTVELNGTAAQSIGGGSHTTFGNLTINNTGSGLVSTGSAVTVTGSLDVKDGTFQPAAGGDFQNVAIASGAVLDGTLGGLTVSGSWTDQGSFLPGTATVTFDGAGVQHFSGNTNFNNLVVGTGAVLQLDSGADLGFGGSLSLQGTGQLNTSAAHPNTVRLTGSSPQSLPNGITLDDLAINPGATLTAPANLTLAGDLLNDGGFDANSGRVIFAGAGDQNIGGSSLTTFYNLRINNPTGKVTSSGPVDVASILTIQSGTFEAADGTVINNLAVQSNGTFNLGSTAAVTITNSVANAGLFAPAGTVNLQGDFTNNSGGVFNPLDGNLNISGDLFNYGTFAPTAGMVTFSGSTSQIVVGTASFASLTLNNPAGVSLPSGMTVQDDLILNQGTFNPPDTLQLKNLRINGGGSLVMDPTDVLKVAGDFTNDGGYTPNAGTLIFNGTGAQHVGGSSPLVFGQLVLQNTGTGVTIGAPIQADGLILQNGIFTPTTGSTFGVLDIAGGTTLGLSPAAVITVTEVMTNAGSFQPAGAVINLLGDLVNTGLFTGTDTQINIGGDLTNSGGFTTSGGVVSFTGTLTQTIGGTQPPVFTNLVMQGSGTLQATLPITVTAGFTLTTGAFAPSGGSDFQNITILTGTVFTAPGGVLAVGGNWADPAGGFVPGTGSVVFDGTTPQVITGSAHFNDLIVTNSQGVDASGSSDLEVTGTISVETGTFGLPANAVLGDVFIGAGGSLDSSGGNLTVHGDWTDNHPGGGFEPGGGSVLFDGPAPVFSGSSTFNHLAVAPGVTLTLAGGADLTLLGSLTGDEGTAIDATTNPGTTVTFDGAGTPPPQTIPSGLDLGNLVIGPTAVFSSPLALTISGSWTNDHLGGFIPNGGVITFTGTTTQVIGGQYPTVFNSLVINNLGGQTVSTTQPITVTGGVTVTSGTFQPADQSEFNDLFIGEFGTLDGSGMDLIIAGDWRNDGDYRGGGGSVTFSGSQNQTIGGTGQTIFDNLIIQTTNGAVVTGTMPIQVLQELNIGSGSFTPPNGSTLTDVVIGPGGTLTIPTGEGITITGTFVNQGTANLHSLSVSKTGEGSGNILVVPTGTYFGQNTVVQLQAAPAYGSNFAGWNGDVVGLTNPISLTMNDDKTVSALFELNIYTLTLTTSSDGSGTALITPSGTSFKYGTVITLTAAADLHSSFTGWSGDAAGSNSPITLTMDADKAVDAQFTLDSHSLALTTSGDGSGSVGNLPSGTTFKYGTVITLTAAADLHSSFTGWSGSAAGKTNPITITMDADKAVDAQFTLDSHTLTLTTSGDGSGSAANLPVGTSFKYGTVITLTASANPHSSFTGWSGDAAGQTSPITLTMNADKVVDAQFTLDSHTLTLTTSGDGSGTALAAPSGTSFKYGTVITLTATADLHSSFTGWGGDAAGQTSPITLTMDADKVVDAQFTLDSHTLTLTTSGDGSGSAGNLPAGTTFKYGAVITLTAAADLHSSFTGWSGGAAGRTNPITITMDTDKAVDAQFTLDSHSLTLTTSGDGSGTTLAAPSGTSFKYGTVITLTATADLHSSFSGWSGDAAGQTSPITITMDADKTVDAQFTLDSHSLTLTTSGDGSGSAGNLPAGASFKYGSIITLTAAADLHSSFTGWSGDAAGKTNPVTITMDTDKIVDAQFTLDSHSLTLTRSGDGSGSLGNLPVGTTFKYGTVITLTATADLHSSFTGWSGGAAGKTSSVVITMNEDKAVDAQFTLDSHTLILTTGGDGSGTALVTPNGTSFKYGAVITLTATADLHSSFTDWSGDAAGKSNPITITMNADKTVNAQFTLDSHSLTLTTSGDGSGSVGNLPAGTTFKYGTIITLTATADLHSSFTGWSGGAAGKTSPITITMDADKTVDAQFTLDSHSLTLTTSGDGSGAALPAPSGTSFKYGTVVTLTATADLHSSFTGWSGGAAGKTSPITITMDADKTVDAQFTLDSHSLTLTTSGDGSGAALAIPSGTSFKYGTVITLTATANPHSSFTGWSGAAAGKTSPITITMDADRAVDAQFTLDSHTLTLTTSGDGSGSAVNLPAGTSFKYGTVITLTATTNPHSSFTGWSGAAVGKTNPITITMDADKTVDAQFILDSHSLTLTTSGDGSGAALPTPSGTSFKYGTVVTLTATADLHSSFTGWSGAAAGKTSSVVITMNADKAVDAQFTLDSHSLTLTTSGDGSGSAANLPSGTTFKYGTVITLTATANPHSSFNGWSGGVAGKTSSVVITMNADKAVDAQFTLDSHSLTLTTSGDGSGSLGNLPVGTSFKYGTVVTLTATANPHSSFAGWSGGAAGKTSSVVITMNADKAVDAQFTLDSHTLTLTRSGDGSGTVLVAPSGTTFKYGSVITLTATAGANSAFMGWSGSLTGQQNPIRITMDGDKAINAVFALNFASLTLNTSGDGSGAVLSNPAGTTFRYGTVVTLTATANPHSTFAGWGGGAAGTANPLVITIRENTSVTAIFTLDSYPLTLGTTGDGAGDILASAVGTSFKYGTVITLTASAAQHSTFSGWSGSVTGSQNPLRVVINGARTIQAQFTLNSYRLTVNTNGSGGGFVVKNQDLSSYKYGSLVTLTAFPDGSSNFGQWTGDLSGTSNPVQILMDGDKSVTATFDARAGTPYPRFTSTPVTSNIINRTYTYNLAAVGEKTGDILTFTVLYKPDWLTLTAAGNGTAQLSGTPAQCGKYSIVLEVRDQNGRYNIQAFTIAVNYRVFVPMMIATGR